MSPIFSKSENDFFGPANMPKPEVVPLNAPNPPDSLILAGDGDGGVAGANEDLLAPPMRDGDPKAGALDGPAGLIEGFVAVLKLENTETGAGFVSPGLLKNGEVLEVLSLPKAPKPDAGRNAAGDVLILANAPEVAAGTLLLNARGGGELLSKAKLGLSLEEGSGDRSGEEIGALVGLLKAAEAAT